MSTSCGSVIAAAFIDLAACNSSLQSAYLTGGPQARVLFVKKLVKSNCFSLVPVAHSLCSGTSTNVFGQSNVCWRVGRQGDYLISSWLRMELSAVTATSNSGAPAVAPAVDNHGLFLRWCHNFAHNVIDCLELSFTSIPGAAFDNFFLDFFSAFSVPAGKRNGYDNMIGNIPELVNPIYSSGLPDTRAGPQVLPAAILNLPIPLPYTRDAGVSLPTGSLIYNDVEIMADFKDWTQLLVVSNSRGFMIPAVAGVPAHGSRNAVQADVVASPTLKAQLWGTYAVVTTTERKQMGKIARDIIWETVQTTKGVGVGAGVTEINIPLRYSQAVKALFFAIRNKTVTNDLSNYTTREPLARLSGPLSTIEFPAPSAFDPIKLVCLLYEGSARLQDMPIDYFSLVQPYYHARAIPTITGYHLYSYSLDFVDINHLGSVDYGKLTNVSSGFDLSDDAIDAMAGVNHAPLNFIDENGTASLFPPGYVALQTSAFPGPGLPNNDLNEQGFQDIVQSFESLFAALAHSVVRVVGGAAGFPAL